jgi:Ser/Thr protein kinase RdoA (MazF antagonist)
VQEEQSRQVAAYRQIAGQFTPPDGILDIQEYGSGNLNDTFLVRVASGPDIILQRINTHVFRQPELIMRNMRTFTEHVHARLQREPGTRPWKVPRVFAARDGRDYFIDEQGSFWRAISFIAGATSYDTVQSMDHARESGYAIGRFHSLISDLDPERLHDTLVGFHVTPLYLEHYDRVVSETRVPETPEVRRGYRFVAQHRGWASVLEDARARGELHLRPIHNDPKINNIMIDDQSGQAVSLVDLDTVKPGLVHYDIGDCLRSVCNKLGEETERVDEVRFDVDLCQAILEGYLGEAKAFLTGWDYAYIYDCVRLIAFELGLRFFTDYLEGDVYFKARYPEHNLMRALVQFKVAESVECQEAEIRAIVRSATQSRGATLDPKG